MELAQIAGKQKRAAEWNAFLEALPNNHPLRFGLAEKLRKFRLILTKCWEAEHISNQDLAELLNLERDLEQINEEVRLTVPKTRAPTPKAA